MSQYQYLIINIFTFIGPLFGLMLFRKRIRISFVKYFWAMIIVSVPFLIWDSIATARLDWWFSPQFTTGILIGNLPLEEMLFFVTTSFACLVLNQVVVAVVKPAIVKIPNALWWIISAIALFIALFFISQYYTVTVFIALAATGVYIALIKPDLVLRRSFWLYALVVYVMFMLVNSILTGAPIVMYNDLSFSTIRVGTIPAEDFVYNFLFLFWYLNIYEMLQHKGSYTNK
jgi:lycopene cyclase domain-containing protein